MGIGHRVAGRLLQALAGRAMQPAAGLALVAPDVAPAERVVATTTAGPVTVHVVRPAWSDVPPPVYVNFHGGGFLMGSPADDEALCRALVEATGCVVLNVDYALAPQHPFPAAADQAYAVTRWAAEHGAEHGWDGARLAVGGQSAGGNLAAGVCLTARERGGPAVALQALLYPPLDLSVDPATKTGRAARPIITPGMARVFDACYVPDPARRSDPLVSPVLAPDLAGLPAALVVTAELDTLRDEADRYAARLSDAGVPVTHVVMPGVDHGFTHVEPLGPFHETVGLMAAALRTAWALPAAG